MAIFVFAPPNANADAIAEAIKNKLTASSFSIINVISPGTPSTEFSITLPDTTRSFLLRCRENATLQLADTTGQTGTIFFTIPPLSSYSQDLLDTASLTLYLECDKASQTVELIAWKD